jgi:hypothetical protein
MRRASMIDYALTRENSWQLECARVVINIVIAGGYSREPGL